MRSHAMGDNFCKDKGKEIVGNGYIGILSLPSGKTRSCGSNVLDLREGFFCGHAHVDHGILVPPKEEPMSPEASDKLRDICQAVLEIGTYHVDPKPNSPGWNGKPL